MLNQSALNHSADMNRAHANVALALTAAKAALTVEHHA